jgi:hypothetical protein
LTEAAVVALFAEQSIATAIASHRKNFTAQNHALDFLYDAARQAW